MKEVPVHLHSISLSFYDAPLGFFWECMPNSRPLDYQTESVACAGEMLANLPYENVMRLIQARMISGRLQLAASVRYGCPSYQSLGVLDSLLFYHSVDGALRRTK